MTKTELNFNVLPSDIQHLIFDKNRQVAKDQRYRQKYDDVLVDMLDTYNEGHYCFLHGNMTRRDHEQLLEEYDEIFPQTVWYRQ